jgi:hypothetical protein
MKQLHNHFDFQPPRSPISPTPPEVEIPMFDQRVRGMVNSNMINEYGSMFFEPGEGCSSSVAPPPPTSKEEVPQPFGAPVGPTEFPPPFGTPVAPPPAPNATEDPEAPPDWAARFSTEIFEWSSYPPPYDGMDDDLHVLFSKITITIVSLLCIVSFPYSYIGGSSHPGGGPGGTRGRDSDRQQHLLSRPLLLLDDKWGEEEL